MINAAAPPVRVIPYAVAGHVRRLGLGDALPQTSCKRQEKEIYRGKRPH